jgi:REP element-mobilizing transposase RayT
MPRPPRLQFPDACYHIINRGNYRTDVFAGSRTAEAFESCLFDACARMGWVLYAHVVMRNHFHLAVRTPRANLSQGMHWLTTTFATRFNRLRDARGHLFQGRFHAILIEPGTPLARVVNYIHLNPVRAKIVPVAQLDRYRWSSFWRFGRRTWPDCLQRTAWMHTLGWTDDASGWRAYRASLAALSGDPAEQQRQDWAKLSRGWAIGGGAWQKQLKELKEASRRQLGRHRLSREENAALDEMAWREALTEVLRQSGRSLAEAASARRGAAWKIALAARLRHISSASVPWLARTLHLGAPSSLRVYLSQLSRPHS